MKNHSDSTQQSKDYHLLNTSPVLLIQVFAYGLCYGKTRLVYSIINQEPETKCEALLNTLVEVSPARCEHEGVWPPFAASGEEVCNALPTA